MMLGDKSIMSALTQSTAWLALEKQYAEIQHIHMRDMFEALAPVYSLRCIARHHRALMSNVFAQTESLIRGKTNIDTINSHDSSTNGLINRYKRRRPNGLRQVPRG